MSGNRSAFVDLQIETSLATHLSNFTRLLMKGITESTSHLLNSSGIDLDLINKKVKMNLTIFRKSIQ
jgi:hypothetical protein